MTKATKWFLAILALLLLFGAGTLFLILFLAVSIPVETTEVVTTGSGEQVALVELEGIIRSSSEINRQLKEYRRDAAIRAILLRINTPGGDAVASQEIYDEVRRTREGGKPVIVSMGSIAASGGYYVACGSSRIVANRGTLTGSIGVIAEFLQIKDAMDKLGIDVKIVKSGELKDAGAPVREMTREDTRYFDGLVRDLHNQFAGVVSEERNLDPEIVATLADGRVFTGEDALARGLVDTLGTFEDALRIAAHVAGIEGEPAVVQERRRRFWWDGFFGSTLESVSQLKNDLLDRPVMSYRFVGPAGL